MQRETEETPGSQVRVWQKYKPNVEHNSNNTRHLNTHHILRPPSANVSPLLVWIAGPQGEKGHRGDIGLTGTSQQVFVIFNRQIPFSSHAKLRHTYQWCVELL